MDKHTQKRQWDNDMPAGLFSSLWRGIRLVVHLFHGMVLAMVYPHANPARQRHWLKRWSRQLLDILHIGIQIEGIQPVRGEDGCLMVSNHVSWLDVFVLNAIHPSQFIAKSEVRLWPIIGWLSGRSGTIFIERAMRQDAASVNRRVSALLRQGACIALFPEGTTTDGKQVGHFHSALIQPAIDARTRLCPIALRYQNSSGSLSSDAAFTGETTLLQSVWKILRGPQLNALVVFTPALHAANENRRMLARTSQAAIAHTLQTMGYNRTAAAQRPSCAFAESMLSSRSTYALLVDPVLTPLSK